MSKILGQILASSLGFWLAKELVPGVQILGNWQTLLWLGLALGLANFFLKPLLNLVTLPLKLLTFGLFGLIINLSLVWLVDVFFPELIIPGIVPLIWTTLILYGVNLATRQWLN